MKFLRTGATAVVLALVMAAAAWAGSMVEDLHVTEIADLVMAKMGVPE